MAQKQDIRTQLLTASPFQLILHQPFNRKDYLRARVGGKEVILSAPCPSKR